MPEWSAWLPLFLSLRFLFVRRGREVSNTINKKRITSAEKLLVDVDALRSLWIS